MLQDLPLDQASGRRRLSQSPRPLSPSRLRQWRAAVSSGELVDSSSQRQDSSPASPRPALSARTPRRQWPPAALPDAPSDAQPPKQRSVGLPLTPTAAAATAAAAKQITAAAQANGNSTQQHDATQPSSGSALPARTPRRHQWPPGEFADSTEAKPSPSSEVAADPRTVSGQWTAKRPAVGLPLNPTAAAKAAVAGAAEATSDRAAASAAGASLGEDASEQQDSNQQPIGLGQPAHKPRRQWPPGPVDTPAEGLKSHPIVTPLEAAQAFMHPPADERQPQDASARVAELVDRRAAAVDMTPPAVQSVAAAAARLEARAAAAGQGGRGRSVRQTPPRTFRSKSVGHHLSAPLSRPETPLGVQLSPGIRAAVAARGGDWADVIEGGQWKRGSLATQQQQLASPDAISDPGAACDWTPTQESALTTPPGTPEGGHFPASADLIRCDVMRVTRHFKATAWPTSLLGVYPGVGGGRLCHCRSSSVHHRRL